MYVPNQEFLHPSQEYLDEVEKLSGFQSGQIPLLESIDKNVSDMNLRLESEANERSTADKKYFWLGAVVSLVISLAVQYLPKILEFVQVLFQRLRQG